MKANMLNLVPFVAPSSRIVPVASRADLPVVSQNLFPSLIFAEKLWLKLWFNLGSIYFSVIQIEGILIWVFVGGTDASVAKKDDGICQSGSKRMVNDCHCPIADMSRPILSYFRGDGHLCITYFDVNRRRGFPPLATCLKEEFIKCVGLLIPNFWIWRPPGGKWVILPRELAMKPLVSGVLGATLALYMYIYFEGFPWIHG